VLFISLPLTHETRGIIGADEISLLPRDAVIINVARGAVIEEGALYEALREGRIHAGLDVWYDYPTTPEMRKNTQPSRFAFQELDNVVMSPHVAGHSDETDDLRARALAEMLNAAAGGKPLPNRVDLESGY
jgi:phosphoglycerate dehydrogenase-like enzyme